MSPLAIHVESQFGAFNKSHSTTGGLLTYQIPTKPAIIGMVGGMLGFSFSETNENLEVLKVGVRPLSATRTKTITYNSRFGGGQRGMINVRQEILIEPEYEVFLDFSEVEKKEESRIASRVNKLLNENGCDKEIESNSAEEGISELVNKNISYYNLYMGKNDFPLNITHLDPDLKELPKRKTTDLETECVMPREACRDFQVKVRSKKSSGALSLNLTEPDSLKFFQLKDMPISQNENREHSDFRDFIMKQQGEGVKLVVDLAEDKDQYNFYLDGEDKLVTTY